MNLHELSARQIAEQVGARKVSAEEVTNAFLARIAAWDPRVKAFLSVLKDTAVAQARAVDEQVRRGEKAGPLAGVPVAVKDNMCVRGTRTTCSSKILENFTANYDATVIAKLRAAGAVFIGKTNLDEFAMGSSTENSAFFTTRNPWNTDYIPGGSSGGSAAAVAARLAPLALGSDTGGSIRQPATCCGVVGMKPTYGLVSRFGLIAFASSLDQIGPFAWNIADAAALLGVIAGHDPHDSTSVNRSVPDYLPALTAGVKGLTAGLPEEYFRGGLDPEVERAVEESIRVLEKAGMRFEKISLPHTDAAVSVYYILAPSEASANLARFDGVRYGTRAPEATTLLEQYELSRARGFGPEVKRRIMLGTYALSSGYYDAYYLKAQKVRTLIKRDFDDAFQKVDLILTPTAPTPAFRIGERTDDPLRMYLSDIFTISCNLAGLPGLSMPCGFSSKGLPLGLQILGKPFGEEQVFSAAAAYEQATDWNRIPPEPSRG
ncbi:MAG TPA: Asp-tRNA(Asn)/Glu-tRNA(Gln) amidotransferase subunit GatA [Elusimicrobiota bacterium]|nr:Asp-tRNA(Asn)/Glu-tRNA(Gln) amidotransferase subunit GatA [Elusimicrobiota bacterium]